jgi:3-hydroxyacyl-CoA dehydrogenase/enoyl-CoA hydratase/3-hydroxybutyryl-CoA epimerase
MIDLQHDADGIVVLTWDMPDRKQNVFNQASLDAFEAALQQALAHDGVRGIVVTSAKRDFIAGADLSMLEAMAFAPDRDAETLYGSVGRLGEILRAMETGGVPVVAALNGTALGGGLELALACHHRIAADQPRAKLGLPEGTLGLLPGAGGTQRLPRMIGVQPAMPLLMEGKRLGVHEAHALGIVDAVVAPDDLLGAARAWLLEGPSAVQPWDAKGFEVPGGGPGEPSVANVFMVAAAMLQAKTYGNYPAGQAILSCLYEGLRVSLDEGLQIERRYFVQLLLDPVAGNLIRTMFLSLGEADKLVRRPAGVPRHEVRTVAVLGGGLMGSGIAYAAAYRGLDVTVVDLSVDRAAGAVAYAERLVAKRVKRGRMDADTAAAIVGRITPTDDMAAVAGADVVVEAVPEDRDIKADVTRRADALLTDAAVFASNTSTLPITGLAEASSRPGRFVGLHFFSPVEKMRLVEVIRAEQTTDETLAHALDVVAALGKTPIVVRDSRGFYTSRVFGTYITEGMAMLSEGVAPALIENAAKQTGMPMPPLELSDAVGLALAYQVRKQTMADLGDDAPPNPSWPILSKLVGELDRTGKRSGRGFYDYDDHGKRLWPGLAEHFPPAPAQPDVQTLKDRFLYIQALEAARCMEEGLLLAAADADVGAVLGWGFAAWTGGPLSYVDTIGAAAFVARCEALSAAFGDRFDPPALLRTMAAEGGRFYPR